MRKTKNAAMARPKKPRFVDGVQLPDNLYQDPRKRLNTWRYVKPDGTNKIFKCSLVDAIKAAEEANKLRDTTITIAPKVSPRDAVLTHVERYITWREGYDPRLVSKQSWKNRCAHMRSFAKYFDGTKVSHLNLDILRHWWETLTYHAQHARRSEFNKLFNYLAGQGITPKLEFNPFTIADDRPRLMEKGKPPVKRDRLSIENYWKIYKRASQMGYDGLQLAMAISLLTTMRRGDICDLQFDKHITATSLKKTINKSANQRDAVHVAHLEFDFKIHSILEKEIKKARELRVKNFGCPFVISHNFKQRRTGKTKSHKSQVTSDQLGKMFALVRDDLSIYPAKTNSYSPPSFHEIRALASAQYKAAGFDVKQVKELMAHTDERVTKGYQAGHGVEYTQIQISLGAEVIGGEF